MIILGLGSNIGNREKNITDAIMLLSKSPGIDILQVSSLYKSEPVGYTEQPYLSMPLLAYKLNSHQ